MGKEVLGPQSSYISYQITQAVQDRGSLGVLKIFPRMKFCGDSTTAHEKKKKKARALRSFPCLATIACVSDSLTVCS